MQKLKKNSNFQKMVEAEFGQRVPLIDSFRRDRFLKIAIFQDF